MGEIKKILVARGRKFYFKGQDVHTQFGYVKAADIKKAKPGSKLLSNTGKEFFVIEPSFIDVYRKIKRLAQIITLKDIAAIIAETAIGKGSVVVDAGTGSGALACFLAHYVKKVYTFDIKQEHIDVAKKNIDFLDLKNVTVKKHDIYKSIPVKNADLITLDVPEPWIAIKNAEKALKVGGFLVSYSPTIIQSVKFVNTTSCLMHIKTIEITEREWRIKDRSVRPMPDCPTGFLSFCRRIE